MGEWEGITSAKTYVKAFTSDELHNQIILPNSLLKMWCTVGGHIQNRVDTPSTRESAFDETHVLVHGGRVET
jgi:hypothetical protein